MCNKKKSMDGCPIELTSKRALRGRNKGALAMCNKKKSMDGRPIELLTSTTFVTANHPAD